MKFFVCTDLYEYALNIVNSVQNFKREYIVQKIILQSHAKLFHRDQNACRICKNDLSMFRSCRFSAKLFKEMCAICLILKEEVSRCSLMSSMYNFCTNKFDNVLICTDQIKVEHKDISKLIKNKDKKVVHAEFELNSKNSYQ